MKFIVPVGVAVCALSISASAQDSTVKSRTTIKADEGQIVTMNGCLRLDQPTGIYSLYGTVVGHGDEAKMKSKVKTDVDKDGTTVKAKTKTSGDAAGTAGTLAAFTFRPVGNVNLMPHIGHQVQIAAVMVDPNHHDADVTIKEKTKVEREHGRDTTSRSKTKIEASTYEYTVVSVKPLGGSCE